MRPDTVRQVADDVHAELIAEFGSDREEAWAVERLARVMTRLNAARKDCPPLTAYVLRIPAFNAFTTAGPYVYIARQLLERLRSDDATAYVLAHEIAHHDCGHLDVFAGWLNVLPRGLTGSIAAVAFWRVEHRLFGPEREAEADLYALELCLDAEYNGELCLQLFDVLENAALDRGAIDSVYGPESLLDPTDPDQGSLGFALQRWLTTRARRYLPLRERRDTAWEWLRKRAVERKR